MSQRLKEIQAQFVEFGDVGIDSVVWLMSECERLHQERAALESAPCVVAVPDGRPCEIEFLTRRAYVIWEGHICVPDRLRVELVRITDNHRYDVADVERFHPMRLVRLEEWREGLPTEGHGKARNGEDASHG